MPYLANVNKVITYQWEECCFYFFLWKICEIRLSVSKNTDMDKWLDLSKKWLDGGQMGDPCDTK